MVVKIWFEAIIDGRRQFSQTPSKLKEQVRQMLIDAGRADLIDE